METFSAVKNFIDDPRFSARRRAALKNLDLNAIDAPIRDIIDSMSRVPYAYTLQCCWGHFVHAGQPDPHGLEPLAHYSADATVTYRLAYLAICLQSGEDGKRLCLDLQEVVQIDSDYIQFGSPDWFWRDHPNSYALQVEPERFRFQDTAMVGIAEALHLQSVKDRMFRAIRAVCLRHGQVSIIS